MTQINQHVSHLLLSDDHANARQICTDAAQNSIYFMTYKLKISAESSELLHYLSSKGFTNH